MLIYNLTDKQLAAIPVIRDKWISIGFSTEPTDWESAEAGIRDAYRSANLEPPRTIIRLDSPRSGAIAASMLSQVRDQVVSQVGAQVRAQVGAQVRAQVVDQVRAQVRAQVVDQVVAQVRDQVVSQVRAQVRDQVGDQVVAQVGAQVIFGQHDAYMSFNDYFLSVCNLKCCKRMEGLIQVAKSAGWWWAFSDTAIVTARPIALHRDSHGKLHSINGPAIEYPDGWCIYANHGTVITNPLDIMAIG